MKKIVSFSVYLMSAFYLFAGVNHFTNPNFFLPIVPPYLPEPLLLVYASGIAEVFLGLLLLFEKYRPWAARGVILLLIAVFPANIYMWQANVPVNGVSLPEWGHYIRFAVQGILIYWAYLFTKKQD